MSTRILSILVVISFSVSAVLYAASLRFPSRGKTQTSLKTPIRVDLGTVDQAKKIPFTFVVPNTTNSPVKIVEIIPSCGCTWVDQVANTVVEPGDKLSIKGILDTDDRRNQMESNTALSYQLLPGGKIREMILTVSAFVRPTLKVDPESLTLDLPADRGQITRIVTLTSDLLDDFTIQGVESSAPWISTQILEKNYRKQGPLKSSARFQITIDFSEVPTKYSDVYLRQKIKIRTSSEAEPVVTLPIQLRQR